MAVAWMIPIPNAKKQELGLAMGPWPCLAVSPAWPSYSLQVTGY